MKYQHILIATDFSKQKDLISAKAQELAEQHQAKLSICHIIEDFPLTDFAYEPMISVDIDMRDALLESGKNNWRHWLKNYPFRLHNSGLNWEHRDMILSVWLMRIMLI
ncbi:hypothetical protein GCM10025856_19210 [Methylophaga marina]|uniref:universal stress protein n=1 Tax=Methylophaga marina TaxID=45495 RepID=UPI0025736C91|nr:universal stress protein [Methylophaga marina]BDZ74202.1 hypothetical protein GCM10025856_19210 [Methylophaga marina]